MAATKRKRTTLPKDFEEQMKKGADLAALQRVFETCEIDARDRYGYGQPTALLMSSCSNELSRWLVAQGADVKAVDRHGNNALHIAARSRRDPAVLIELGCDVSAPTPSGDTPLHAAADAKNMTLVERLLAAGAEVNATNREGLTPLEMGLRGCTNIEIERMVPVAQTLLAAGARRTLAIDDFVRRIGKTFEFHRAAYAKDLVEATSTSLVALCELFGLEPPARREMHDGMAVIKVNDGTWQRQHSELWNYLVPSSGAAATVQGEAIRISGRISDEIYRNGGGNWDADFTQMARAFLEYVRGGRPLEEDDVREAEGIVDGIVKERGDGDHGYERLAELAVEWVRQNPRPIRLGKVAYKR